MLCQITKKTLNTMTKSISIGIIVLFMIIVNLNSFSDAAQVERPGKCSIQINHCVIYHTFNTIGQV